MAVFGYSLEGKPPWHGLVIGLIIGGLVFFLFNRVYLKPMREDLAAKERELGQLQVKIQQGRSAKQKLPQFREEVRHLEVELEKLLRILPARRNTPDLLRRIRTLAEQGDFDLKLFATSPEIDREFYNEYPITISLDGNYHSLALFFDRISRFPRIVNVDNLKIRPINNPANPHSISANFVAKTFVYKEPETLESEDGEEEF